MKKSSSSWKLERVLSGSLQSLFLLLLLLRNCNSNNNNYSCKTPTPITLQLFTIQCCSCCWFCCRCPWQQAQFFPFPFWPTLCCFQFPVQFFSLLLLLLCLFYSNERELVIAAAVTACHSSYWHCSFFCRCLALPCTRFFFLLFFCKGVYLECFMHFA